MVFGKPPEDGWAPSEILGGRKGGLGRASCALTKGRRDRRAVTHMSGYNSWDGSTDWKATSVRLFI